jgi:hypothetical protein
VNESLELQVSRLGELLRAVGPEPMLQAPLVTPTDDWFPDRWSSDLESVRRVLFRLAEYAGLPEFDIDVIFCAKPFEGLLPGELRDGFSKVRGPNHFLGFHADCAWFCVDYPALGSPHVLVAHMAHEMARCWRTRRGLLPDSESAEAGQVAVTAVMLGFGILTCNVAYEYDNRRESSGLFTASVLGHVTRGPLPVEDLAGLLACWARLRGSTPAETLKHLAPTQAQEFRKASNALVDVDLWSRLGLPGERPTTPPPLEGASDREFPAGHAARAVHASTESVVAAVGDDGGIVPRPLAFPVAPESLPNRTLAAWGRVSASEFWRRRLSLVSDPEWDTELVVVDGWNAVAYTALVVGHVRDRVVRNHRQLRSFLISLFSTPGPVHDALVPSLPTYVAWSGDHVSLGEGDLEAVFKAVARSAAPDQLARETAWLKAHVQQSTLRLETERASGGIPVPPADAATDVGPWWMLVSNPDHVREERAAYGRLVDRQTNQDAGH